VHAGVAAVLMAVTLAACASPPRFVPPEVVVGERAFAQAVEAHTLGGLVGGNRVDILLNGDEIFPAMLHAIRAARASITLANYIWETGAIADELAEALAERCRAGLGVNVLVDAVGSHAMSDENRALLTRSGCHFVRFRPLNPLDVRRVNHRNHRRVLVVDGRIAFTGGTGIGTKWAGKGRRPGHWRQTDVRVEGPVVRSLQAAFAENWRDETGILLAGEVYFPSDPAPAGEVVAQIVRSSPGGGSTEAYALFLIGLEGARRSVVISSPYFVPDREVAAALARAVARGVRVSVLATGEADNTPDRVVRMASRAEFGRALEDGVKIFEYRGAMLHAKTVAIDGRWAAIGSINIDRRSFGLNHEASLVAYDPVTARRLEAIFAEDLRFAQEVTLEEWKRRGIGHFFELFVLPLKNAL
jgi:cardiolipin synthase A/B